MALAYPQARDAWQRAAASSSGSAAIGTPALIPTKVSHGRWGKVAIWVPTGGLDLPNVSRLEMQLKPPAHLAVRLSASHMTVSQRTYREHDAVATVLIIGASRGIGLETVKATLTAGHSVRALAQSARRIPIDHPKLEKMAGDAALVDPRDWTCGLISRADVADFLVKQIDDDTFLHKTPVLKSFLRTSSSEPTQPPRRRAA
jgi:hypothetical protein